MTVEQALIRIYQQAARRLRIQIRAAMERGAIGTAAYHAQQLEAVQTILRSLGQRTRPLSIDATFQPYIAGATAFDATVAHGTAAFAFAGAHQRAATILAHNLAGRLDDAVALVGRRTDDAFRRVALEQTAKGVVAGATRREVSAALGDAFIRERVTDALTGFVDSRGARWQLDTYSEMVARTTTREAVSAGLQNRMVETGQLLVKISEHGDTDEVCAQWAGKTFALPGQTVEGYATIPKLPPFHPRCIHVAGPAEANLDAYIARLRAKLGDVPA